jgi:hypothetical protein
MTQLPKIDRVVKFFVDNALLFLVLLVGLVVWATVFNLAVTDYLDTTLWRTRGVWLGNDTVNLFGFSVSFQFEGYTDYSFYYVHWGHNMLRGLMPYDPNFGHIVLNGYANDNGAYIFPPFFAYLYAAGIALPFDDWGIGLLISAFGYLTALPVYGIAKELSHSRRVGQVAALTYLLNPVSLYYSAFVWLNPAPFVFFFFSGFYALLKEKKCTGTILIVCAALFKQTAWFLGIPLVVYLLVRPQKPPEETDDTSQAKNGAAVRKKASTRQVLEEYFDLRGFLGYAILVIAFIVAVLLPFIIATPDFLRYLALAAGGFPLDSYTELPGYGSPMRFQVLPVAAGLPELAQFLDIVVFYGFLLTFGVMIFFGLMLLEKRQYNRPVYYMRRLLLFTMLMMLWVHLMGPRGVYKYYFVLFVPFFSIFSSVRMVTSSEESVPFSYSMLWVPLALSLVIIIPQRTVYLFGVLLIFLSYLLAEQIGAAWNVMTTPLRWARGVVGTLSLPLQNRVGNIRQGWGLGQTKVFIIGSQKFTVRFVGALDQLFRRQKLLQSKLYRENEVVSEKTAKTWCQDAEDLSLLTHTVTTIESGSTVEYKIEHLSSMLLALRVRRNGEEVSVK